MGIFHKYVLKIALKRSIFQLKMHGSQAPPGPVEELTALPDPLALVGLHLWEEVGYVKGMVEGDRREERGRGKDG